MRPGFSNRKLGHLPLCSSSRTLGCRTIGSHAPREQGLGLFRQEHPPFWPPSSYFGIVLFGRAGKCGRGNRVPRQAVVSLRLVSAVLFKLSGWLVGSIPSITWTGFDGSWELLGGGFLAGLDVNEGESWIGLGLI